MKDHRDYRTLHWTPDMDGPWSDAAAQRYVAGGYHGVRYLIPRGVKHASLDFLLPLPDLQYLNVQGPVTDDSAVNQIESLEHLTLLTRSKVPLAVDRLQQLHHLAVDARRDLTSITALAGLQRLYLAGWRGPDLTFLGGKPRLVWLRLDGRPGRLSLHGVQGCTALQEFEVLDYRLPSLVPLRGLTTLERILLSGPRAVPADNDLDLEDLASNQNLGSLRLINAGTIRSLRPLQRLPRLRDFRFNEVVIADGDLGVLFTLPSWVEIVPPTRLVDDPHRYSHSLLELRNLGHRNTDSAL